MKRFGIVLWFLWVGFMAHGQQFVRAANTLDQLLALNPNYLHTNALVLGRSSVGDGQPGIWSYDRSSSTATNDSPPTVTKPNNYGGRWKLILAPAAGAGTGDVVGPPTATDNAIARFDGPTGELLQNSSATIADTTGDITAGKFNGVQISGSATPSIAVTGAVTLAGANNGDQTITLTGDVTGSGTGSFAATIPNGTITTAKMGGDVTAAGKALMDDASAAAQRATLQLVVGTDVQAYDAELTAWAGLASAADTLGYFNGSASAATTPLTAAGRALIDDASAAAQRATLQLVPGTDVQSYDAELAAWAGLTSAADTLGYFNGSASAATTPLTAAGRAILDDIDAAAQRATLDVPQTTRSISTQHSLTGGGNLSADRTLSLVNDSASPGNNKVYGTDGSGVRGWKNDPAGGGSVATDTIWNVAGDLVFGTGADTAARLAPPTQLSGSILYYGPSGVEWVNGDTHFIYRNDFNIISSTPPGDFSNLSSSGSVAYMDPGANGIGGMNMSTGTTSTGYRHQFPGTGGSFEFGRGRTVISWRIKLPNLSNDDAVNQYTAMVGTYDAVPSPVDGVWFQYTHSVNSGKWECKVADNSSTTTTDSTITVAANTWYTMTIDVNAGATEAKFYINHTLVHTESGANIPQAGRVTAIATAGITKSAGTTARILSADYLDIYVKY